MNYDIVLAGDSWCYLWYDDIEDLVIAPPLKHDTSSGIRFLEILFNGVGLPTFNTGSPGQDNYHCIEKLTLFLKNNKPKYVIYFFTESVRKKTQYNEERYDQLYEAAKHLSDVFYEKLTEFNQQDALHLAKNFIEHTDKNTQCLILGGHEEFKPQFLDAIKEMYPNDSDRFHLIHPNIWLHLFKREGYRLIENDIPYHHRSHTFLEILDENCDEALIDSFLRVEPRRDRVKASSMFVSPDGGHHPNAAGQFIVFNDLLNYIYNLEDKV